MHTRVPSPKASHDTSSPSSSSSWFSADLEQKVFSVGSNWSGFMAKVYLVEFAKISYITAYHFITSASLPYHLKRKISSFMK